MGQESVEHAASSPGPDYAGAIHAEYLARKYFGELDGLRAFAIAMVVWNHSGSGTGYFGWGLGVKLFFTISGFLITSLLLREQSRTGTISLRNFYVRRVIRIFPLYFAVLGIYTLLVLATERDTARGAQFFENLPYYLTFTSNLFINFDGGQVIYYFAWSLSAQEQFYLVWPSVIRMARRWWVPVVVMASVLLASEGTRWAVAVGRFDESRLVIRVLARLDPTLGLGALAAYVLHRPASFRAALPLVGRSWSAPLAVALAVAQVFVPTTPEFVPRVAMMLLVMACVVRPDNVLAPVLDNRAVRHVGTVSYGIYLMHMLNISAVRRIVPDGSRLVVFALAFPATVAVASLSFRYFETPVTNLKRFFVRKAAAKPATPAPAS
jgi:peptidoglycan/LPS O-acetylase OafA/YrhL